MKIERTCEIGSVRRQQAACGGGLIDQLGWTDVLRALESGQRNWQAIVGACVAIERLADPHADCHGTWHLGGVRLKQGIGQSQGNAARGRLVIAGQVTLEVQ